MNKIELADASTRIIGDKDQGADKALQRNSVLDWTEEFRTMTEHSIPINELCSSPETHGETDLTDELAHLKLLNFGPNKLMEKKSLSRYCVFL